MKYIFEWEVGSAAILGDWSSRRVVVAGSFFGTFRVSGGRAAPSYNLIRDVDLVYGDRGAHGPSLAVHLRKQACRPGITGRAGPLTGSMKCFVSPPSGRF